MNHWLKRRNDRIESTKLVPSFVSGEFGALFIANGGIQVGQIATGNLGTKTSNINGGEISPVSWHFEWPSLELSQVVPETIQMVTESNHVFHMTDRVENLEFNPEVKFDTTVIGSWITYIYPLPKESE